jgi:hypothetical protein
MMARGHADLFAQKWPDEAVAAKKLISDIERAKEEFLAVVRNSMGVKPAQR